MDYWETFSWKLLWSKLNEFIDTHFKFDWAPIRLKASRVSVSSNCLECIGKCKQEKNGDERKLIGRVCEMMNKELKAKASKKPDGVQKRSWPSYD